MKWISIYDSLPELDEEVLVFVKGITCSGQTYESIWISNLTTFFGYDNEMNPGVVDWVSKVSNNETVTHWMKLPEVPT